MDETGKTVDAELPEDIYKEIVIAGPPSEEKRTRELIDEMYRVRKDQILLVEEIDKLAQTYTDECETIRGAAMGASTKIEVQGLSVALRAVNSKRGNLAQRRLLCKLLDNKLGDLRAKLLTMGKTFESV